jgi:proteasome lid subunit RPN8/RPN11
LEDFHQSKNIDFNKLFLKAIKKVAHTCDFEICGGATEKRLFLWENSAPSRREGFYIEPNKYFNIFKKINFFFHSHPFGGPAPSDVDIFAAGELQKPFVIYSVVEQKFCFYSPKTKKSIYFCL